MTNELTPQASGPTSADVPADSAKKSGLKRRTVITGAAWSIPVVAVTVATPLAAASVAAPSLSFTNGPYSAGPCAPLGEIVLILTTNGTDPDPGKSVTVVLPAGLTWSDGTNLPKVFSSTDVNGNISIPAGQIVASTPGDHTITATASTGVSASAPASFAPNLVAKDWHSAGGLIATFAPAAAVAIGWNFFLGPDGTLYHGDGPIATNVSSAVGDTLGDASTGLLDGVAFVDGNGVAQVWQWNPSDGAIGTAAFPGVPTGSTAVGWSFFLASNGDLYYGDTLVDSGVTSAVAEQIIGPTDAVTYVSNGQGKVHLVSSSDPANPVTGNFPPAVPLGGTAVGHNFLLAANGDLFHSSGVLVASGVTAAVGDQLGDLTTGATDGVSFIQNGVAGSWEWLPLTPGTPTFTAFASVPAGSTPVGWNFFLAPGGLLYHGNDLIAQNVVGAVGGEFTGGVDGVTYVESVAC